MYLIFKSCYSYYVAASHHICALMTRMCDRVLISRPNLHAQVGHTGGLGTILLVTHLQCIHPGCRFGPLICIPVPRCWCRGVPRRTRPQC